MGKHDSRLSKKMRRRQGKAGKRRTEARKVAVATELRKQGKKTKKMLFAPPPPPKAEAESTESTES